MNLSGSLSSESRRNSSALLVRSRRPRHEPLLDDHVKTGEVRDFFALFGDRDTIWSLSGTPCVSTTAPMQRRRPVGCVA